MHTRQPSTVLLVSCPDRRGIGLGLHISKSIVEAHGGRMWVETKLGEGSTFSFVLPLNETA